ncbi:histidinol-phosphatase [Marinilabiliaceae bacterium JC017]|nr:histidinol-phosphatase [Marinilabiliaceae bacterium JC017]
MKTAATFLTFILTLITLNGLAQYNVNNVQLPVMRDNQRTNIRIPHIDGFVTLKGDLHMHTVFSDGKVWPAIRVQEAWEEGLDVIAITDHLEYLPHKKYLTADHNASYELALAEAKKFNLLLVKGCEITRHMPPGHFNALFIKNANLLDQKKAEKVMDESHRQGGLLIWNHPGWQSQQPDTTKMFNIHRQLIKEGKLHGMEVANEEEWYPIVLQWCLDHQLAVMANSDIHEVTAHFYDFDNHHRFMTLLFAKERSLEGVKEAIKAARTVAWFGHQLAGPEVYLDKLFKASVTIGQPYRADDRKTEYFELTNHSDFRFDFVNKTPKNGAPEQFTLLPNSSIILKVKKGTKSFPCTLTNVHTGMHKNLQVQLR